MSDVAVFTPASGRSWFISGLGVAQIASWGSLYYSFPLIATAMEADLGWSKTALYGAATLGALLSAVLAVPILPRAMCTVPLPPVLTTSSVKALAEVSIDLNCILVWS